MWTIILFDLYIYNWIVDTQYLGDCCDAYENESPIHSECRLLLNQGHIDVTVHDFRMSDHRIRMCIKKDW